MCAAAASVGLEEARLLAGWPVPQVRAVVASSTSGRAEVRLVMGTRIADRKTITVSPGARQAVTLADPAARAAE